MLDELQDPDSRMRAVERGVPREFSLKGSNAKWEEFN